MEDRQLKTRVKPKTEAEAEFREAVHQGHSAAMMKATSPMLYSVDLGNLKAMQECTVQIEYLKLLNTCGSAVEWTHTATWVPPYLAGSATATPQEEQRAVDAQPAIAQDVSYTLSYEVEVLCSRGLPGVSSATHQQQLQLEHKQTASELCGQQAVVVRLSDKVSSFLAASEGGAQSGLGRRGCRPEDCRSECPITGLG